MKNMNQETIDEAEQIIYILRKVYSTKVIDSQEEEKINNHCSKLFILCIPKELEKSEDIPYTKEDFAFVATESLPYIKCYQRIVEELCELGESLKLFKSQTVQNILLYAFIIISHFQNADREWSDQNCSTLARHILEFILKFSRASLSGIFFGNEIENEQFLKIFPNGILKLFLINFSEKITKYTWKKYPFYIESYIWVYSNIKAPYLSEYISYLLPVALFILDDWEQRNKIIGIKALHHILLNIPQSELRWYGRAEVIYDALKHHMFSREAELLEHIYPTLILAASVLENDPRNVNIVIKKKYYDDILSHLLREMAYEEKLVLRSVYVKAFKHLSEVMAISLVRWSKDVLDVCAKYLSTYEGEEAHDRQMILEILQIYIKNCWPRIWAHSEEILKMVLKFAFELSLDEPRVANKDTLVSETKSVVELLSLSAPDTIRRLTEGINDLNIPNADYIKYVLADIIS